MPRFTDDAIRRILRATPRLGSAELRERLGNISRATLKRRLDEVRAELVVRGGSRRIRYALRRALRGRHAPLPLFRIDEQGRGHEIGQLDLTEPEGCALSLTTPCPWPLDGDMADGWFESLPYFLFDMRPQGYVGRHFARRHALDLQVPENPVEWSDDDIVYVLSIAGWDQPGDLIIGETAFQRFLEHADRRQPVAPAEMAAAYPQLAERSAAGGEAGSSAAGEFPKFTTCRLMDGEARAVIVKFSGAGGSPAETRWADLLVCEHLALEALRAALALPVATSRIHRFAGRTFLEVERFDRHGLSGRSPVCTLGAMNPALLGTTGSNWPKAARQLAAHRWLADTERDAVLHLFWFGRLVANTDMHDGNLTFLPGLRLGPAYDMLPMAYAPLRGGELVSPPYRPQRPMPGERTLWLQAAATALHFWQAAGRDARISDGFRAICAENAIALADAIALEA